MPPFRRPGQNDAKAQHHIDEEHAAYPDHGSKDMERYEQGHTLKLSYDFGLGSAPRRRMSALGQKQTSRHVRVMSVIPLKADIRQREWHVRYVPLADLRSAPTRRRTAGLSHAGGKSQPPTKRDVEGTPIAEGLIISPLPMDQAFAAG